MKIKMQRFMLLLLGLCFVTLASAQQKRITGTVKDNTGAAIAGASVQIKGTETGTTTDDNGNFGITVSGQNDVLVISAISFAPQEVSVGTQETVDVFLEPSEAGNLEEVVVTALGVKREKKSLGYAVQEVKGETLVEARETNLVNTLSGKVAGLQVVRSSNGPAGSSKIVLRGNNSLTGSNQPLVVVDGVPVDNFTGATNNDYWNPSLDMGNGLADINAEDIENVSILKGPSAAALYGSRAGNGVILITTKTGRKQAGLGITVSSSIGIESIFTRPELQNDFGQGDEGGFDNRSNLSWGPKAEGQSVENWNGEMVPLTTHDNVKNYFRTGIISNQSVSFQQQFNGTSIYTSIGRMDDKSMIPGTKLSRTSLMGRAVSRFGKNDRWTTDTKIQYTNSNAENRPIGGPRGDNSFYALYLLPRSLDVTQFSGAVNEFGNMVWFGGGNQINPYWNNKYNLNQDIRDRFILTGSLKYQFTDWLSAEARAGSDLYITNTEAKIYGGSPLTTNGRYSLGKQTFTETNYSTLITASKDDIISKVGAMATVGGNLMAQKFSSISGSSGELEVPNLFSLNNGVENPSLGEGFNERRINSAYGSFQLSWDNYLFLDATFRNDWSSTLSKTNRSFFYPSLSLSYVFTDMFASMGVMTPDWLTYGKLRASYASVGNDLPAYQLYNTYGIGKDPNGNTTASRNSILLDPNVRSELIKSYEFGAEFRFFNNRLGLDVSYYKSNATRQLINLPMDPLSGYSAKKINAGDIENSGIEIMANARILTNPNSLMWNIMANFSTNRNLVNSLAEGVTQYALGGFDDVRILAVAGEKYGEIYGTQYVRVTDKGSPHFGKIVVDGNGLPQRNPASVYLGNQQADALLGITNSFAYKGFNLSFLVDGRFGGKIFSGTLADMQQNGTGSMTVVNGKRENIVVDAVVWNEDNSAYEQNTVAVTPQLYWESVAGVSNLGITEANLYDATNIRLRNVQLSYELPKSVVNGTPFQKARFGITANNVWLIKSHMNGLDPESVFATGTNAIGFENGSAPTSRTILFNLTLGF